VLWGTLPHAANDPDLLIVARWPTAAERDPIVEAELDQAIELMVAIRNARSTAGVPAGEWRPTHLSVPDRAFETFDALRPAIARLVRAQPIEMARRMEDLPHPTGALEVVLPSADVSAVVLPVTRTESTAPDADRGRLEKELAEAEGYLEAARARLANDSFTSKAPAPVVEGARVREAELTAQVARLRSRLKR
jgi:valyl-tRNA synthetase